MCTCSPQKLITLISLVIVEIASLCLCLFDDLWRFSLNSSFSFWSNSYVSYSLIWPSESVCSTLASFLLHQVSCHRVKLKLCRSHNNQHFMLFCLFATFPLHCLHLILTCSLDYSTNLSAFHHSQFSLLFSVKLDLWPFNLATEAIVIQPCCWWYWFETNSQTRETTPFATPVSLLHVRGKNVCICLTQQPDSQWALCILSFPFFFACPVCFLSRQN